MTTERKPVRLARTAAPTPHASAHPARGAKGDRYWVVLQGDTVSLETGAEAPDTTTRPGERRKRILIGTTDKALADAKLALYQARARGVVGKGEEY